MSLSRHVRLSLCFLNSPPFYSSDVFALVVISLRTSPATVTCFHLQLLIYEKKKKTKTIIRHFSLCNVKKLMSFLYFLFFLFCFSCTNQKWNCQQERYRCFQHRKTKREESFGQKKKKKKNHRHFSIAMWYTWWSRCNSLYYLLLLFIFPILLFSYLKRKDVKRW